MYNYLVQPALLHSSALAIAARYGAHSCALFHASQLPPPVARAILSSRFHNLANLSTRRAALWALSTFRPLPQLPVAVDWIPAALDAHYRCRLSLILRPQPGRFARWLHRLRLSQADDPIFHASFPNHPPVPSQLTEGLAQRVETHIRAWTGDEPGPNRSWVENYLADLSPAQRAIARFTLLAALSPRQIDPMVVDAMLQVCGQREAVPELAVWATCRAVVRISEWLPDHSQGSYRGSGSGGLTLTGAKQ